MRVFVTGASGFIGTGVVHELIRAGHQVLGLARSDSSANALIAAGAQVHRGLLEDLESLRRGASAADGVIHLAFNHDFSKVLASAREDQRAIEALGSALAGSDRPLVVAAGVITLKPGKILSENDTARALRKSEQTALGLVASGVNASVVRLPPSVHGEGDKGFMATLIAVARKKAVSGYVGNGLNRWSSVHRLDAAQLFRLALEKGQAGAKYHAVADEGMTFKDIANVIGQRLNVPVVAKPRLLAIPHFGWLGLLVGIDCPASSQQTRALLGWQPQQSSLQTDLEHGSYFKLES